MKSRFGCQNWSKIIKFGRITNSGCRFSCPIPILSVKSRFLGLRMAIFGDFGVCRVPDSRQYPAGHAKNHGFRTPYPEGVWEASGRHLCQGVRFGAIMTIIVSGMATGWPREGLGNDPKCVISGTTTYKTGAEAPRRGVINST